VLTFLAKALDNLGTFDDRRLLRNFVRPLRTRPKLIEAEIMKALNHIVCSIGIMAYNEEANIGSLLAALLSQHTTVANLSEIIVVASGCTDSTEAIVQEWAARDPRVRLMAQPRREGKASAVNYFLAQAREDIVVLTSADVLPEVDTLDKLLAPFLDPNVGMTSGRPIPVNEPKSFMGFAAHMLWDLHHHINVSRFKAGEMIAFRRIFKCIPYRTPVDEASVEPVIRGQGYQVRYVPTAIVHNKGSETVKDFLVQRRRIYAGHLAVREVVGYTVSTMSGMKILVLVLRHLDWRPRPFFWTWAVAALEVYGRFLGWRDYKEQRDHSIWEVATTTKELEVECSVQRATGTD
jgi:poly-beta-1,6-N-acetyl-D-glucosamine synthase